MSRVLESLIKSQKYISAQSFKEIVAAGLPSNIVPIDATWYLPNAGRNGYEEFKQERIPGSVFLDIDEVKDEASPYPHMMPDKKTFDRSLCKTILLLDKYQSSN
ncbi:Tum1p [Sugiyamaella lignohabitans]|uniref:Tum1p n=1 Tax=Sugiyamaella lignohabitans TaxID=796027 RepID=A0A167FZ78_9ASCO|nr:Tum1p [Sugiyamaella lignohabitans]ANB15892.1 Tum1p [Sugiyamaella lignohabitans]